MNAMMRSAAIYGSVLVVLLGASWADYTAEPELELDGKVLLVPGELDGLTKVTWSSRNRDEAIIERKEDGVGTYYDVQYTRWTEVKKPEPLKPPEPDEAEGPKTPDEAAADGADTPDSPEEPPEPEPEPEYESKETAFKAGVKGDELFTSLSPMLALRKLGDMSPEKMETTGLDDPKDALILERSGKTTKLEVGGEVYGTRDRYVRDPATGEVYLVDDELLRPLRYARTRLPDRTLWSFDAPKIKKITIGSPDGSVEVLHQNPQDAEKATWVRADTPEEADEQLETWMAKAMRMKSSAYADADDEIDGIELLFSLTIEDESGKIQTLEVLRKPDDDKANYWGRSEHTRGTVKLLRGQTRALADDLSAIIGE
jgi:hypothetical protein